MADNTAGLGVAMQRAGPVPVRSARHWNLLVPDAHLNESRSLSLAHYLRPDLIPRTVWRQRELIAQLVQRSVSARYRGSILGLLWSFLLPLIMLAVYTFVFSVVFKSRWGTQADDSRTHFALTLFCGLLLYNVFAETLSSATGVIVGNPSYVKRVVFPLEVLPVVSLGAALVNGLISFGILLIGLLVFGYPVPWTVVYFPAAVLPLMLVSLGLGWFVASVGVYVRDLGQVVTVVLQVLFFVTPIFYPTDVVPPQFQIVMRLNPLSLIVENARRAVLRGLPPEWPWLIAAGVVGLVALQLGYAWFMKTKRGFADVL